VEVPGAPAEVPAVRAEVPAGQEVARVVKVEVVKPEVKAVDQVAARVAVRVAARVAAVRAARAEDQVAASLEDSKVEEAVRYYPEQNRESV
jgi:hypothetical protein